MVIQRDEPFRIWGWAESGEKFDLCWQDMRYPVTADGRPLIPTYPNEALYEFCDIIEKYGIRKRKRTVLTVSVFALCAVCGTAVMFSQTPTLPDFILVLCSALISAGCVTFCSGTVDCIRKKRNIYMLHFIPMSARASFAACCSATTPSNTTSTHSPSFIYCG